MDHFKLENLGISFGGLRAVQQRQLQRGEEFDLFHHRPQRFGEDHDLQHDQRHLQTELRPDHLRRGGPGGLNSRPHRPQGGRPHLSEHRALLQRHGDGQPPPGPAYPHENGCFYRRLPVGKGIEGRPGRDHEPGNRREDHRLSRSAIGAGSVRGEPPLRQDESSSSWGGRWPWSRRSSSSTSLPPG